MDLQECPPPDVAQQLPHEGLLRVLPLTCDFSANMDRPRTSEPPPGLQSY
jgi:hypothetical protein